MLRRWARAAAIKSVVRVMVRSKRRGKWRKDRWWKGPDEWDGRDEVKKKHRWEDAIDEKDGTNPTAHGWAPMYGWANLDGDTVPQVQKWGELSAPFSTNKVSSGLAQLSYDARAAPALGSIFSDHSPLRPQPFLPSSATPTHVVSFAFFCLPLLDIIPSYFTASLSSPSVFLAYCSAFIETDLWWRAHTKKRLVRTFCSNCAIVSPHMAPRLMRKHLKFWSPTSYRRFHTPDSHHHHNPIELHRRPQIFRESLSKNERVLHTYAKELDGDDYEEYAKCAMEDLSCRELYEPDALHTIGCFCKVMWRWYSYCPH